MIKRYYEFEYPVQTGGDDSTPRKDKEIPPDQKEGYGLEEFNEQQSEFKPGQVEKKRKEEEKKKRKKKEDKDKK